MQENCAKEWYFQILKRYIGEGEKETQVELKSKKIIDIFGKTA